MVRLLKDAASPDPEARRKLQERATEIFAGVGVAILRVSEAAHQAMLGIREAVDPVYRAAREKAWAAQWPLYPCPYERDYGDPDGGGQHPWQAGAACGQVWDRRRVTAPELRGLVWEHIQAVHVGGERGQQIADMYASQIMDRP